MTNLEMNNSILFLFTLIIISQSCVDLSQMNGFCTECISTEILQNGFCFPKIRGCLEQRQSGCLRCQQGYILSAGTCTRQAQILNIDNLSPPPVVIEQQNLRSEDIQPVISGGFKETTDFNNVFYKAAQAKLYEQFPELATFRIYKVQEQVVNGMNYIFYIIDLQSNDLYLARIYVTLQKVAQVTRLSKNDVELLEDGPMKTLTSEKTPVLGGWQQFTDFKDPNYIKALQKVTNHYEGMDSFKIERVEYQIVAGTNYLFFFTNTLTEKSFIVQVYQPFYGESQISLSWGQVPQAKKQTEDTETPTVGGFQVYDPQHYDNQPFVTAKSKIREIYPTFSNEAITRVQQQIVAGTIYIVWFTINNQKYEIKLFVPLPYKQEKPSIYYIKQNDVEIPVPQSTDILQTTVGLSQGATNINRIYSWVDDQTFERVYKRFTTKVGILNLPPATEVEFSQDYSNEIGVLTYKVIYNEYEYAIFRYYPTLDYVQVVSYMADNTEVYRIGQRLNLNAAERSQHILLSLIKLHNSIKYKTLLIENIERVSLSQNVDIYYVKGITQTGTHIITIIDDGKLYFINQKNTNPDQKCFSIDYISKVKYNQQFIIEQLSIYLVSKYKLKDYKLSSALVQVQSTTTAEYRMLYSQNNHKQILVLIEKFQEKYIIKTLKALNEGLAVLAQNEETASLEAQARNEYQILSSGYTKYIAFQNQQKSKLVFANENSILSYQYFPAKPQNSQVMTLTGLNDQKECLQYKTENQQQCKTCKDQKNLLFKGQCYTQIENCEIQLGNICQVCSLSSVLSNGMCISGCKQMFSS